MNFSETISDYEIKNSQKEPIMKQPPCKNNLCAMLKFISVNKIWSKTTSNFLFPFPQGVFKILGQSNLPKVQCLK